MPEYLLLKQFHVTLALLSVAGFCLRWAWLQQGSPRSALRLTKVLPHILDSLLLLSGAALALIIHRYPVSNGWLSAKMLGLVCYIIFGAVAMKLEPARAPAITSFVLALLAFSWMVSIALSKDPAGFVRILLP